MSQPAVGGAASAGSEATGAVLGSTLLVSALDAGALSDYARDSLLVAQREAPTATTLSSWFQSYADTLQQLSWMPSSTVSMTLQLDQPHKGASVGKTPTACPWVEMRTQLGQILTGPVSVETVDAFVRGLSGLTGDARARWAARTVLGSEAVCVVAVAAPVSEGASLAICSGLLTYSGGSPTAHLRGFPDAPVPVAGATLSLTATAYILAPAAAEAGRDQLNAVVSAVLPSISSVRPAS